MKSNLLINNTEVSNISLVGAYPFLRIDRTELEIIDSNFTDISVESTGISSS